MELEPKPQTLDFLVMGGCFSLFLFLQEFSELILGAFCIGSKKSSRDALWGWEWLEEECVLEQIYLSLNLGYAVP